MLLLSAESGPERYHHLFVWVSNLPNQATQSSLLQALIGEMRKTRGQVNPKDPSSHRTRLLTISLGPVWFICFVCSSDSVDHECYPSGEHTVRERCKRGQVCSCIFHNGLLGLIAIPDCMRLFMPAASSMTWKCFLMVRILRSVRKVLT